MPHGGPGCARHAPGVRSGPGAGGDGGEPRLLVQLLRQQDLVRRTPQRQRPRRRHRDHRRDRPDPRRSDARSRCRADLLGQPHRKQDLVRQSGRQRCRRRPRHRRRHGGQAERGGDRPRCGPDLLGEHRQQPDLVREAGRQRRRRKPHDHRRDVGLPPVPRLVKAPVPVAGPTVTGSSQPGSVLSCSTQGAWAPDLLGAFLYRSPARYAFQWTRNGADISGAGGSEHVANVPGAYRCRVTASNAAGRDTQTSGPSRWPTPSHPAT